MTLNGVMAITLRYFTEFGKPALQDIHVTALMWRNLRKTARVYCILLRVY